MGSRGSCTAATAACIAKPRAVRSQQTCWCWKLTLLSIPAVPCSRHFNRARVSRGTSVRSVVRRYIRRHRHERASFRCAAALSTLILQSGQRNISIRLRKRYGSIYVINCLNTRRSPSHNPAQHAVVVHPKCHYVLGFRGLRRLPLLLMIGALWRVCEQY